VKLKGKITLVTGGGQGIGKAISKKIAKEGSVVVVCDKDYKKAKITANEIKIAGHESFPYEVDVSLKEQVEKMFKFIDKKYGKLDILVNNAGISPKQSFENISLSDWNKVLSVNLTGTFLCTKQAYIRMKKNNYGKIINISSGSAQSGGIFSSPHYVASKAGIIGFTKSIAKIAGRYNINVNAIAPGRIVTNMYYKDIPGGSHKEINDRTPLKRPGEPEEIADSVLFLASEDSKYITGTCLNVNGGLILAV